MRKALAQLRRDLALGLVIPACPLALTQTRRFDERHQRALLRYYAAAGAGGVAVGVHTTQFAIHAAAVGLYQPVLALAAETLSAANPAMLKVAGLLGDTAQAQREARVALDLGFDCGLLSLARWGAASDDALIAHCRAVAEGIPLFGFYLQPSVGGRLLSYSFWRRFAEIENVVAIKIAPFNRYQTLDVVRAVADSGRGGEIALYTGNDDHIIGDLLTEFRFGDEQPAVRIVGGLLGHWAVWTRRAVEHLDACHAAAGQPVMGALLTLGAQVTDSNAALFDAAHGFAGCIAGLHETLRRQGLLAGAWCLDPNEGLSPGQMDEIDRVCAAYPHLQDDEFVRSNLDHWLV
jgi:hypothetical protein